MLARQQQSMPVESGSMTAVVRCRHCEAGPDKEHQQQKPRLLQYYTPAVLLKRTQVCKHALATWCATNDHRQVQSKLADTTWLQSRHTAPHNLPVLRGDTGLSAAVQYPIRHSQKYMQATYKGAKTPNKACSLGRLESNNATPELLVAAIQVSSAPHTGC
jgi:hypothetical protein